MRLPILKGLISMTRRPMSRERKDGFVTSERSKAFADLLYHVVVKLDCGATPIELGEDVVNLGKAMGRIQKPD